MELDLYEKDYATEKSIIYGTILTEVTIVEAQAWLKDKILGSLAFGDIIFVVGKLEPCPMFKEAAKKLLLAQIHVQVFEANMHNTEQFIMVLHTP